MIKKSNLLFVFKWLGRIGLGLLISFIFLAFYFALNLNAPNGTWIEGLLGYFYLYPLFFLIPFAFLKRREVKKIENDFIRILEKGNLIDFFKNVIKVSGLAVIEFIEFILFYLF